MTKRERLQNGETFKTKEPGNSMEPLIKSRQEHILAPATLESVKVDDIVFCRVNKGYVTHLVKAKDPHKGALIGNNKGGINGWTKAIYGKVIKIL